MYKILIADDDYAIRLLYQAELTEDGYEVISASDAKGLLEMIAQQRPDLILLDPKMEEMNELGLLQDIRKANHDLPIIVCTANYDYRWDPQSVAADSFVVKSSDLRALKLSVKMAIDGETGFLKAAKPEKAKPIDSHPAM